MGPFRQIGPASSARLAEGVALTPDTRRHASRFANLRRHEGVAGIGHSLSKVCPAVFAEAALALLVR